MAAINLNKLLPRLNIRAKLAIAFAGLTIVPLAVVALVTTVGSVRQLRQSTRATLEYDLEVAALGATREIRQAEQHLSFLTDAYLRSILERHEAASMEAARVVSTFLTADSSAIFRVKAIDAEGRRLFEAGPEGARVEPAEEPAELLYAWMGSELQGQGRRILPVELREYRPGRAEGVIPAVAILQAVRDSTGRYLGVGVVEAEAEELFAYLETASPGLAGTTGLVTSDGLFLYHSEYKRDWSSLLARQSEVNLFSDFSPELAQRILEGASGTSEAERGLLVGFRPIHFGPSGAAPLALYRAVPASVVWAPVRRFLTVTLVVGVLITTLVLVVSVLAAQQFSGPILQLQRAANELARGGEPELPVVETNDEIEDLAHDFGRMATALIEHRRGLERMVEERTRELRVARTELHEVVSNARDAIIGIDTECRVRLWNRGAEELFGYPAEEAEGHDLDELILPDDEDLRRESEYVAIAARRMGSVSGLRTRRRTRCGEVIDVSLTYSPIVEEDGTFRGAAVIVRDDRMGREMEEQMRRSERLAAISIMAAGIAHELNNPLAVMANRIELMQRDIDRSGDAPAIAKDLEVLGRQIGRIKGITSDLLNFAREEDGDPVAVDMRETAERVGRLLEHTFLKKNVHLAFEIEDELPSVMGSERAIETVLVNLLINAVQATPEGGRVCVRLRRDAGEDAVVLEVEDSGTGVPDDLRTRIFQPFFTTKASAGGTGLGLAVCRAVMERHRGALTLHDAPSGGALFRAVFPLSQENT